MKSFLKRCTLCIPLSLLLLCSCATTPEPSAIIPASDLPAEVTMNKEAGRGGHLFVTVRLESGEELPFGVDTGAPISVFDTSLEPKLGKCFLRFTMRMPGDKQKSGVYVAPRLYLGNTPLMMTGTNIVTYDCKGISSAEDRPILGILGMDVLEHYCIQLDFQTGKMRFLDPSHLNAADLGKAFPLISSSEGEGVIREFVRPFIHHSSLIGGKDIQLLVDTGNNHDGAMKLKLFRRQSRQLRGDSPVEETKPFPKCVWEGGIYTNLKIDTVPIHDQHPNAIGLRFLARHLITLNFPGRTMYLKQTSVGPLVVEDTEQP